MQTKPHSNNYYDIRRIPRSDAYRFKGGIGVSLRTEEKESSCKHDFEFKYMKEKMTEDGRIITLEYFHCRHCLEEKVKEK